MATSTKKTNKPAAKPAAKTTTATNSTKALKEIGIVVGVGFIAGDIYSHLFRTGEASLNDLKQETGHTPAMLQMAVGWLAREDKITITKKGAGFLIRLNH